MADDKDPFKTIHPPLEPDEKEVTASVVVHFKDGSKFEMLRCKSHNVIDGTLELEYESGNLEIIPLAAFVRASFSQNED